MKREARVPKAVHYSPLKQYCKLIKNATQTPCTVIKEDTDWTLTGFFIYKKNILKKITFYYRIL